MCKKLCFLISVVFMLGMVSSAAAADPDLVAQYNFENNVQDSTANAYHGTVIGTAVYVDSNRPGGGKGFSFDGASYISLPTGTVTWADDVM